MFAVQPEEHPARAHRAHLAAILETEEVEFEADALDIIADAAQGSMRDALSVVDQAISFGGGRVGAEDVASLLGTVRRDEVSALLGALADADRQRLLHCADELAERNADFADVLAAMQRALHDIAMAQAVGGEVTPSVRPFVERMSPEDVQCSTRSRCAVVGTCSSRRIPRRFEMTLIRMLVFAPETTQSGGKDRQSAPLALPAARPRTSTMDQPPPVAGAPGGRLLDGMRQAPASREGADGPPAPAEPLQGEEPMPDLHALIGRMQPSGVTRMVLDNCQLASHADNRWELVLAEEHDILFARR